MPPRLAALILLLALPAAAHAQGGDIDLDEETDVDLDDLRDSPSRSTGYEVDADQLDQRVLIVPLAGETPESTGVGSLLDNYLRLRLGEQRRFTVLGLDDAPPVEDTSSELYYEGCPSGEELGCQFVIGEGAEVDRVVSGRVTVRGDDTYRIVLTILNVGQAALEFSYALDIVAGEEDLLPSTLALALDRLQREEQLAPVRDADEQLRHRREAVEQARNDQERRLVGRMEMGAEEGWDAFRDLEERKRRERDRVWTEEDLADQKDVEGVRTEWDSMGLTQRQFLQWKNSRLEFDEFRTKWAGHRLMLLGSVYGGFVGGATGVDYYGRYLLGEYLQQPVANYAWQQVGLGGSATLGFGVGIGVLRNLDVEFSVFWMRTKARVNIGYGNTVDEDGLLFLPGPEDWQEVSVDLWGGEVMVRWFVLNMTVLRPTIGVGVSWLRYPDLFPEDVEEPPIQGHYVQFDRIVDVGPQIEGGLAVELHHNVGLFVRVPLLIGANPQRSARSGDAPPTPLAPYAVEPPSAPFGVVRVVVGVQGRLFGLPLQPKRTYDDSL